jgi:hypothetical protein
MGVPTSAVLAEIFIQFLEHTHAHKTPTTTTNYYRYVDDILIIYNSEHVTSFQYSTP